MSGFSCRLVAWPSTHITDSFVPKHPNHSGKPTHLVPCSVGLLRVAAVLTAALGQHISFKVFAGGISSHPLHISRVRPRQLLQADGGAWEEWQGETKTS